MDDNLENKFTRYLKNIYSTIPEIKCQHCNMCCGPIIWFEPEETLIREYMKRKKIKRIVWTTEEFKKNNMKCPYLIKDRCIIYPVRPMVCRLQGNIIELRCKFSINCNFMSHDELKKIQKKFIKLIKKMNGLNSFYSTHIITN